MKDGINRILNDQEITALGSMILGSRFTVEGNLAGAHRSPHKGFSVEFSDYRQYVSGDDLRHLDWKVWGRNERLYIRQYEEECNLRVYFLVDASKSMSYAMKDVSKYDFACRLASALAYVTVARQDSIGLAVFDKDVCFRLPAKSGFEHLRIFANMLVDHEPVEKTNIGLAMHKLAESLNKRSLIVILSDLFEESDVVRKALAHFRRRKHDVILYHVLDNAEMEFPFRDTGCFEDLETGEQVVTDSSAIRQAYHEAVSEFLNDVKGMCAGLDVDYVPSLTNANLIEFVREHLSRRKRRGR